MASVQAAVVALWEIEHGQTAECFAVLVKREELLKKDGEPYFKCHFRAKQETRPALIWSNHQYFGEAHLWDTGIAYRLKVVGERTNFGNQIKLLKIDPAGPADEAEGYRFADLVESTEFNEDWLFLGITDTIKTYVTDEHLRQLLRLVFRQHSDRFRKMPAAQTLHHAFSGGLLEHVWSLTRLCSFLADHYAAYYRRLNPPLDKGLIVTAAILHDIGKLHELSDDPFEPTYTLQGRLIGHIALGRDMVRDAAKQIDGFPAEKLMLLEHAILAHHGKKEFGAPVVPQTLEALIVSFADEIDAKVNAVTRELMRPSDDEPFTNKVYSLDNRRFYRGVPVAPPSDGPVPPS